LITAGTLLGSCSIVAALGLATTVTAQVASRFHAVRASEVVVRDRQPGPQGPPFPADAEARLARIDGVIAAGTLSRTRLGQRGVRRTWRGGREGAPARGVTVLGATPGALRAAGASAARGRLYDQFHELRGEPVAVLGAAVAARLGVGDLDRQPALLLGGQAVTVIGVVDHTDRRGELLDSVMVPASTAARLQGSDPAAQELLIHTVPGAARLVGRQAPLVLRPDDPDRLASIVAPKPEHLRAGVSADLAALFPLLAGLSLAAGAGTAMTALAWGLARRSRAGPSGGATERRRWQHARRRLVTEGVLVGTLGGLLGACLGVAVVAAVAAARRWTAVVEPLTILLTPLLGMVIGGLVSAFTPLERALSQPPEAPRDAGQGR
jgi:putative ABC transport system permease protein